MKPISSDLETENWCHTECMFNSFSFKWKIDNFLLSPEENGCCLESSTFPADTRFKWKLRIFPRGAESEKEDSITLFLVLNSSKADSPVVAKFEFSILDRNKEKRNVRKSRLHNIQVRKAWGKKKFITRNSLLSKANDLLHKDYLIIYCKVEVLRDPESISNLTHLLFEVPDSLQFTNVSVFYKELKLKTQASDEDHKLSSSCGQFAEESWCHTETKLNKVTFTWKIDNFLEHLKEKGKFLSSSRFSTGNGKLSWRLHIYPRGIESYQAEGHVSLFLVVDSAYELSSVYGKYEFCIISGEAKETNVVTGKINSMSGFEGNCGETKFVSQKMLEDKAGDLLPDGHLLISCVVEVFSNPITFSGSTPFLNDDPDTSLSHDLGSLLGSRIMSDVVLCTADDHLFAAHKVVLSARSPVFAAMFQHEMKENLPQKVEVADVAKEVLQLMLQYIYTDKVSEFRDSVVNLLAAAGKYGLDGLKSLCEKQMIAMLSVNTATEFLIVAETHKAYQLRAEVVALLKVAAKDIVKTDGWRALIKTKPDVILELMKHSESITPGLQSDILDVPDNSLFNDFGNLLQNGKMSDVVLTSADGQAFAAHKVILSVRSPFFAAMFLHGMMKEKPQNRVEMANVDKEVLQGMIQYIYTDRVSGLEDMPKDLLIAAETYALGGLKNMCEQHLMTMISVYTAAEFLILAYTYNASELKAEVIDFLETSAKHVVKTSGWKTLVSEHSDILLKVMVYPGVAQSLLSSL